MTYLWSLSGLVCRQQPSEAEDIATRENVRALVSKLLSSCSDCVIKTGQPSIRLNEMKYMQAVFHDIWTACTSSIYICERVCRSGQSALSCASYRLKTCLESHCQSSSLLIHDRTRQRKAQGHLHLINDGEEVQLIYPTGQTVTHRYAHP